LIAWNPVISATGLISRDARGGGGVLPQDLPKGLLQALPHDLPGDLLQAPPQDLPKGLLQTSYQTRQN
nr:hypothetical protein [Tanacetum cinerariifolium]